MSSQILRLTLFLRLYARAYANLKDHVYRQEYSDPDLERSMPCQAAIGIEDRSQITKFIAWLSDQASPTRVRATGRPCRATERSSRASGARKEKPAVKRARAWHRKGHRPVIAIYLDIETIFAAKRPRKRGRMSRGTERSALLASSLMLLMLTTMCWRLAQAHVALTFPRARQYDLDFLDNVRTPAPCGMPRGKYLR